MGEVFNKSVISLTSTAIPHLSLPSMSRKMAEDNLSSSSSSSSDEDVPIAHLRRPTRRQIVTSVESYVDEDENPL